MTTLYKIVDANWRSCHGGTGGWQVGRRRSVRGTIGFFDRGLHLCTTETLPRWLVLDGHVLECQASEERLDDGEHVVVRWARPTRWVGSMSDSRLVAFAADCAERALSLERSAGQAVDRRSWAALARDAAYAAADVASTAPAGSARPRPTAARAMDAAICSVYAAAHAATADGARAADAIRAERRWQGERLLALLEGR